MTEKMNFESALLRLEEITKLLEEPSISLDDSVKLYEEGVLLSDFCTKELKNAELKIIELSQEETI